MRTMHPSATLGLTPFSFWLSLPQLITWGRVFYTFSLLMTPLEAELGMSRAASSLAFSMALLAEGVMAYWVGRWIDAGHERQVMTWGSVWVGLGLWGHSHVTSVAGFYAAWIWLGLGMAATLYTPVFALVTRRYPHDFRRAIITLTFLGGLASTVFIPLFSWGMALWGWRHALWLLAVLQWGVCAPLHAWLLRGAPASTLHWPENPKPLGLAPEHAPALAHPRRAANPGSVREHLQHAPFWLLAVFMVLMMAVTAALPAHMIALLQEAGLSPTWVIAVPAAIGVIQVVGRLVLYGFEHRWDVHIANRWIPSFIPLGLAALLLGGFHPTGALVFVVLFGLGNGMITIVKGTALAQYVSREHVGQLNGLLGLPIALARAGAPLALGLLWSPTQGYTLALIWLLVTSVLATLALWVAQKHALQNHR